MKRKSILLCGCGAVKTFEDGPDREQASSSSGRPQDTSSQPSSVDALLLAFQRLPDKDLCGLVTNVSKTWQATAAAALSSRLITIAGLAPGTKRTAAAVAWLCRYSGHIQELHINHAEVDPQEWAAILSLPFPKLAKLEITRSRLNSAELSLLTQFTSLRSLTLNSVGSQLRVSFVQRLGSCLTGLSSLQLKSCGVAGEHLQGLTPLVQANLTSLDLFDNPGIGADVASSNKALAMWATGAQQQQQIEVTSAAVAGGDAEVEIKAAAEQHAAAATLQESSDATAAGAPPAAPVSAMEIGLQIDNSSTSSRSPSSLQWPQSQQQQQQLGLCLRQLQLSYCNIKHLPAISQLTSLTSLNLLENSCDQETVTAIGQLQQLQELVLEDGVSASIPAAAFAALSGLANLELLDISGGPTGCLDMVLGCSADGAKLPAAAADKTAAAAAAGWPGLRVKWSGRGRPPAGFRVPEGSSYSASGRSTPRSTASPRITSELEAPPPAGAPALGMHRASRASSMKESAPLSPAMEPATPGVATPSALGGAVAAALRTPSLASSSGWCGEGDGSGSPLSRLRRLEAEQVGLSDHEVSAIVRCCSQLQELDISHNHVGPEGIARLHSLTTLTHLNISTQQPTLGDAAAPGLVQLKQLKGLDVGGNSFSKSVEIQLQREGSSAGGHLTRLTGCGMRSEVSEPWVQVSLERQQAKLAEKHHKHHPAVSMDRQQLRR